MLATVALAATGCGGGGGLTKAEPHATVPTAPLSTTTTNPYAVPATIDAPYVNRVLDGLDGALGDILRLVFQARQMSTEAVDRVQVLYLNRDDQNLELQELQYQLRNGFSGFKDPPGNRKSTVTDLLAASPTCIFVRLSFDHSAVATKPNLESGSEWMGLTPADPARDPNHYNPTPWAIATEGVMSDGSQPPNPCAGSQ